MSDKPKHKAEYESYWVYDYEESPFEGEIDNYEFPELECPKCKLGSAVGWDELERGTEHECYYCKYEWEVA
jgi:hypothetical protein